MFQQIEQLNDRQYKSLTGVSRKQFAQLSCSFSECEFQMKTQHLQQYLAFYDRTPSAGGQPFLKTASEKLFFLLFYLKNYPSFDVYGFTFGCSGKTAHENLYKFLPVLVYTLQQLQVLPKRNFDSAETFIAFTKEHQNIIIDATERIHHRKTDQQEQKAYYNAKKKTHTIKNTLITTTTMCVLFLGYTALGSTHDFKLLKQEFPQKKHWFEKSNCFLDLGYLGFDKQYVTKKVYMPHKKPRKSKKNPKPKLSDQQKQYNKTVSQTRVKVENAIAGIKRFGILVQRFRNKSEHLRDQVIHIAAGIWNFNLGVKFNQ